VGGLNNPIQDINNSLPAHTSNYIVYDTAFCGPSASAMLSLTQ